MSVICDNCNKEFTTRASLQYHIKQKVCKKGQNYKCKYCNKLFSHKSSLSRHINNSCDIKNKSDIDSSNGGV